MSAPPLPTQDETIAALLARSKRAPGGVPIRSTFVQRGQQRTPRPGPLATIVRNHDERALDLKLLHQAVASGGDHDVTLPAGAWARALGLHHPVQGPAAVSKTWRRLEDLTLVVRDRNGRLSEVTLLREDGSGKPYTHPYLRRERYFKLPLAYWTAPDRWYATLSLAGKAMLLVALSLPDGFYLPFDKAKPWYGLSADTAEAGFRQLRDKGVLKIATNYVPAPLSPRGYIERRHYTLRPPFGPRRQKAVKIRVVA